MARHAKPGEGVSSRGEVRTGRKECSDYGFFQNESGGDMIDFQHTLID